MTTLGEAETILENASQFFSFDMEALIDDVYNCMDDYISDSLDHLENAVSGLKGQSNNMALIQKSSDELMHEMRNCFDKNFDKLEIYILKNIFHVPGEVCLKYGNASKMSVPFRAIEAEEDVVDNEIMVLRRELRKAQVLKTVLVSECKRAAQRSGDAKRCMEVVKNLKSTLGGEDEDNLSLEKIFSELSTDVGALRQLETRMNDQRSRIVKGSARSHQSRIPKAKVASRKNILHKILEKRTNTRVMSSGEH